MKIILKIFFGILIFVLVVVVGGYIFLAISGKQLFSEQASKASQYKITVGDIKPIFPSGIEIDQMHIEGLADIDTVKVFIDLATITQQKIRLTKVELEHPIITYAPAENKPAEGNASTDAGDTATPVKGEVVHGVSAAGKQPVVPATLEKLIVRNGELKYTEPKNSKVWHVVGIDAEIEGVPLNMEDMDTRFDIKASLEKLKTPFVGNELKAKGVLNVVKKDMDATAQAVDGKGTVVLDTSLVSKSNDLTVSGKFTMGSDSSGNMLASLVQAAAAGMQAQFSFHTLMDRFDISKVSLTGNFSSGLNNSESSGNIVADLKSLKKLFKASKSE